MEISCITSESLEEVALECESNTMFTKAGAECLQFLENAIEQKANLAKGQLAQSNQARVIKAGGAQAQTFSGAGADYAISQAALTELIAAGKAVRAQIDEYGHKIYFPEYFDDVEEEGGDIDEFLDDSECYADAERSLKELLARADSHIADLEKAKLAANAHGSAAQNRESKGNSIASGSVGKTAVQGAGAPAPKKAGVSNNNKSTISGLKKDKEKRAKKPNY